MTHDVLIKAVLTNKYEVELFQTETGYYTSVRTQYHTQVSFSIPDYNMVSYMFDMALIAIEGQ